jgi:V8-like Glu-specific endopeptidase
MDKIFENPEIHELRNQAALRYNNNLKRLNFLNKKIAENRLGNVEITSITDDEDRLKKRMSREEGNTEKKLERINGVADFQDIHIVDKLVKYASSVCRIIINTPFGSTGYGTGFMIAPNILLTNNHVLPDADTAAKSSAQFDYQLDEFHNIRPVFSYKIRPDILFVTSPYQKRDGETYSGLDFTLVWLDSSSTDSNKDLREFGFVPLDANLGKIIEGENCVVIQHPQGDLKKIVLKDIRMISLLDDYMIYESDTLPGASGSPVIALGTGEVVALHHSAVPRTDDKGNWLRKDGKILQPNDNEKLIDWMGNEGIRVSRILHAIDNMDMPQEMKKIIQEAFLTDTPDTIHTDMNRENIYLKEEESISALPLNSQYFEVEISPQAILTHHTEQAIRTVVKDLVSFTPLFPISQNERIRRIFYLTIHSSDDPWIVAEKIEQLPQVEHCIPDLPVKTDIGVAENYDTNSLDMKVQELKFIYNTGWAEPNQEGFIKKWIQSKWYKKALENQSDYFRWWNWEAVNLLPETKRDKKLWDIIYKNIAEIKIVQLDTGYSNHSKIFFGLDLEKDYDFIDSDIDAKDPFTKFIAKHPGHGTRTSSLCIGGKILHDNLGLDGNGGFLCRDNRPLIKLIPYRIAQSVILIGRGKELVRAARYAIQNQTDVMFISMGSYPRPMIEAVVMEVYEKGIIWVCATGNEVEEVVAPALYPGTISVAAMNPDDHVWKGSSHGKNVDIAAPGEDVYVPFLDKEDQEIMVFGSGTSYATPQVAAAAVLWKARWLEEIESRYLYPWQIVEAFRLCLRNSSRKPSLWNKEYGEGILDIEGLLKHKLPEKEELKHAYANKPNFKPWDNGVRQVVHVLWNGLQKKSEKIMGLESMEINQKLTERGKMALQAFGSVSEDASSLLTESTITNQRLESQKILHYYFENQ